MYKTEKKSSFVHIIIISTKSIPTREEKFTMLYIYKDF
jgi:hypothetical protein